LGTLGAVALAAAIAFTLPLMMGACSSDPVDSSCPNDLPTCANNAPSYKADIAPIMERRCLDCHADAGSPASSKNFSDYDHVFAQRSAILNNVYACKMPKKPAAPLAPEDRQKLLLWLKCNAPNN
jgi:hypothetical protein